MRINLLRSELQIKTHLTFKKEKIIQMENRNQIIKKENNQFQLITEFEVESKLDILVKGQTKNSKELQAIREDLQRGFIGLAL